MKILLVHCHYRLPGGEDTVFAAERAMLECHGHTVFVYERSNAEPSSPFEKLLLPLRTLYSRRAARDVQDIIKREGIELVHVHNTLLVISPSVLSAAKRAGVPVVQTLHNFRLFCPNGILMREGRVCEDCPRHGLHCAVRRKCYRGSRAQSLIVAVTYTLHRLLGTYRNVTMICLTPFDRQKLLELNAMLPTFTPERLVVKPNCVALHTSVPPLPWAQRKNQLVMAGRMEELKGVETVLEAWQLLGRGETVPELLLAGAGPLEEKVRQAAAQNPKIHYLGQLQPSRLHELMAESKGLISASLCYETFALTPAEAHAVGTPVLASDLGNVGGAVQEGVDGLHFTPGDAASLADAVRRLDDAGAQMNLTAIQKETQQRYGEEENYRQLMEIYHKAEAKL